MKYIGAGIFIAVCLAIVSVWLYNANGIREITKLEKELKLALETQEELEKELDKKIIYYDENLDLGAIKTEMESKGMTVANEIVYFEIEE